MRAALALLACSGCSLITDSFATNEFSGDAFPTYVDMRSGAVILGITSGGENHEAVLDVLSPLTLIDPGANVEATIETEDLILLGDRGPDLGDASLPRAAFDAQRVLRVHPCTNGAVTCTVGVTDGVVQPFTAILGADALAGDALRLRLGDSRVFVLADVGGSNADRTFACDAVFPSPYRGGGTLIVANTEVAFAGRRPTIQACLGPLPDPNITQMNRGTDALFAVSSSIGPSLLSVSAFTRYQATHEGTALESLPEAELLLPSGPVSGRLFTMPRLALVARASSEPLAPCRQFFAHHVLDTRDCGIDTIDCPCEDGDEFCPVPASVDVRPAAGIPMLVVPDNNPTLQALRTEFRPTLQEIDGVLGTGAMRTLELDVDYPHNRMLARCTDVDGCETRPALGERDDRPQIVGCLAQQANLRAR